MFFVRFVCFASVGLCLSASSWCMGLATTSDSGTPWTLYYTILLGACGMLYKMFFPGSVIIEHVNIVLCIYFTQ